MFMKLLLTGDQKGLLQDSKVTG